jgi:hypothetical protein
MNTKPGDKIRAAVYVACSLPNKDERSPSGRPFDIKIIAASDRVARDRGVITIDAWGKDLGFFSKNPVIMWAHDYSLPPIAVAPDVQVDLKRGLMYQWWRFLTGISNDEYDRFAARVKTLYQIGAMRAASVGWQTHEYREPTIEEKQQAILAGEREPYWVVTRAELLETSAVPVPADPYALTVERALKEAAKKGHDVKLVADAWDHLRTTGKELPALVAGSTGDWQDRVRELLKAPAASISVPEPGKGSEPSPEQKSAPAAAGAAEERPFAGYEDFADCVAKNQDKEDPKAYCAAIKKKVEGKGMPREITIPVLICMTCRHVLRSEEGEKCGACGSVDLLKSELKAPEGEEDLTRDLLAARLEAEGLREEEKDDDAEQETTAEKVGDDAELEEEEEEEEEEDADEEEESDESMEGDEDEEDSDEDETEDLGDDQLAADLEDLSDEELADLIGDAVETETEEQAHVSVVDHLRKHRVTVQRESTRADQPDAEILELLAEALGNDTESADEE